MRTNTQQSNPENPKIRKIWVQTIAVILALAAIFTFSCSSDDGDGGGGSSLESLLANIPKYQQMKKELEYYDPDNSEERCTVAGVVEFLCENTASGDIWYNPLKQDCYSSEVGTYEACGGEVYVKLSSGKGSEKCENNILLRKCGDEWYNHQTQDCKEEGYNSSTHEYSYSIKPADPKSICNGVRFDYDKGYRECRDGVVKRSCGDIWYNREEYCDRQDGNKVKPLPKCDGMYMQVNADGLSDGRRCTADGKTLERECGSQWYNSITQACKAGIIKNKTKCSK